MTQYIVDVINRFNETLKEEPQIKSQKHFLRTLNELLERDGKPCLHPRVVNQLNDAIKNNRKSCKWAEKMDNALDLYNEYKSEYPKTKVKETPVQNIFQYIVNQLNQGAYKPDHHLLDNTSYFVLRRAYSLRNTISISVLNIFMDEDGVLLFRNFKRGSKLGLECETKGLIFKNSSSTANFTGISNNLNFKDGEALFEHIHLNTSSPSKDIYNGLYLGCCLENSTYTPFATRVLFVPLDQKTLYELKEIESRIGQNFNLFEFSSSPTIERFIDKYHQSSHPRFDNDLKNSARYESRVTNRLEKKLKNHESRYFMTKDKIQAFKRNQLLLAKTQNAGYFLFKRSLREKGLSIDDVLKRITNELDDDIAYGGLRDYQRS